VQAVQAVAPSELEGELSRIAERVTGVFDQVREISRGIHRCWLSRVISLRKANPAPRSTIPPTANQIGSASMVAICARAGTTCPLPLRGREQHHPASVHRTHLPLADSLIDMVPPSWGQRRFRSRVPFQARITPLGCLSLPRASGSASCNGNRRSGTPRNCS
jgi:hypothetical protein